MAAYDWPVGDRAFWPKTVEPYQYHNGRELVSSLSGDVQTAGTPGSYWGWTFNFDPQPWDERARLWAWLTRLEGKKNRARLWSPNQPLPSGTINLSGVNTAAAAQFANTIGLRGCGAGRTLLPGDWFAIGAQLVQCVVPATSDSSGNMTVEFRHSLRAAMPNATPVVLDHPVGLYILTTNDFGTVIGVARAPEFSVEFREVFA